MRESDDPGSHVEVKKFPCGGKKVSQQAMKDISYEKVTQYHNVNNINQMRLILGTSLIHKGPVSLKWPLDFHFSKWDGWMPSQKCFSPSALPTGQKAAPVRLKSPTKMNGADDENAKSLSSWLLCKWLYPILCRTRSPWMEFQWVWIVVISPSRMGPPFVRHGLSDMMPARILPERFQKS